MASFGVINPPSGEVVQTAPHVSSAAAAAVFIAANIASLVGLFLPLLTYVVPVFRAKGLGSKTIHGFLGFLFTCLFCLLYAIPSQHATLIVIVNCVGLGIETFYILFYLKYTAQEKYEHYRRVVIIAAAMVFAIVTLFVPIIIFARGWSAKVLGIISATYATLNFLCGLIDVVILARNKVSGFSFYQLTANLASGVIWTSFGFLYRPIIVYTVVPNIASVAVTVVQLLSHTALFFLNNEDNAAGDAAA